MRTPAPPAIVLHEIPAGRSLNLYMDRFHAEARQILGSDAALAINPGGQSHFGAAAAQAVRDGEAQLGWLNTTYMDQAGEWPAAYFLSLPFTINDQAMAEPSARHRALTLLRDSLAQDYHILGLMRVGDHMFVSADRPRTRPEDYAGARLRIPAPGVYARMVDALDAQPVQVSPLHLVDAVSDGRIDSVFTSLGGWDCTLSTAARYGLWVRGMMCVSYCLAANRAWFDSLAPAVQAALDDAARRHITDQWQSMQDDDRRMLEAFVTDAISLTIVDGADAAAWRDAMAPIRAAYAQAHPAIIAALTETGT